MNTIESPAVRGKTIRFSWKDGPTKNETHEHVFHEDGTVEWHGAAKGPKDASAEPERPNYSDEEITSDVRMVSYLSKSGYTLTVALNFENGSITGIASNAKTWIPVHGSFEVM